MVQFSAVYAMDGLVISGKTYTEGGLHRPPINADLNANQATMIDWWSLVTPRPGEEYSVMELPTPSGHAGMPSGIYDPATMWPIRFIAVKLAAHLVNVEYVYGWVDDISVKVMKGQNRVIVIRWHPDWYLTMRDRVHYGAGRILRGPQSLARPESSQPRRWIEDSASRLNIGALVEGGEGIGHWVGCSVVMVYTKTETVSGQNYTRFRIAGWTPNTTITIGTDNVNTIGFESCYRGEIEEFMGIDATAIVGAWICPFFPFKSLLSSDIKEHTTADGRRHAWYETPGLNKINSGYYDFPVPFTADDDLKVNIVDINGIAVGTLPWGTYAEGILYSLDIGTIGASLLLYFYEDKSTRTRTLNEGRSFSIALTPLPITSNDTQSYIFSGQREYDIRMREIQKEQAAVNGIAGVGSSAIGGAVAGSLAGGPAGTAAGAIAGIVSSTVGTAVSYVSAGHYDKKTQEAVDKLTASQTATPLVTSYGTGWMNDVVGVERYCIVFMERDAVSAAEISAEHDELGYPTDSYSTNCASLINSGGGLKIEELVTYGVNVEASRYIEALFARGVHIDISSP